MTVWRNKLNVMKVLKLLSHIPINMNGISQQHGYCDNEYLHLCGEHKLEKVF